MGWSLTDKTRKESNIPLNRWKSIERYTDYEKIIDEFKPYGSSRVNHNIVRLKNLNKNDLVWLRDNGSYYLGRITSEKALWRYVSTPQVLELDVANQVTDIDWIKIGGESSVPGCVTTSFIQGHTLQKINKNGVQEVSEFLYNMYSKTKTYKINYCKNTLDSFYSFISPTDCEDLLCLWLYFTRGYIAIPSTNKKATELYECVLINPKNGMHIYPQVKNGNKPINLDADNYTTIEIENKKYEVWLLTVNGVVKNAEKYDYIHVADKETLYNFVNSPEGKTILPPSILMWKDFFSTKAQY